LLSLLCGTGLSVLLGGSVFSSFAAFPLQGRLIAFVLLLLGIDIRRRGKLIDVKEGSAAFDYYMHVWKVFYACYVMLPFLK
jgi:hypothetical protein